MTAHVCRLSDPWPTGHPLPPEDPARLTGPEVGTYMLLGDRVVRVVERSYVWSPGECRHNGGYRRYDWSVIEYGPGVSRIVVNDTDLAPLPEGARPRARYTLEADYR